MLAATYATAGTPDVLSVREVPVPEPGPGQARVRIAVAGINPTDWKRLSQGGPESEFAVPCQDGAGTIDAVGSGVPSSRVGERVWIALAAQTGRWGAAAEYSIVPSDHAVPLPAGASFELGACLGVPALTAAFCLLADGSVDGRPVLVSGGAGAVGQMAVQIARFSGAAPVIATVSGPEKGRIAASAGAHAVVDYRSPDAADTIRAAAPDGIDRIVEVALADNLDLDLRVAAPDAVITSYAADADARVTLPVRELMTGGVVLRFMLLYTIPAAALADAIGVVSDAVAAGALVTPPLHRFGLRDARAAFEAVRAGAVGKVLLEIS